MHGAKLFHNIGTTSANLAQLEGREFESRLRSYLDAKTFSRI